MKQSISKQQWEELSEELKICNECEEVKLRTEFYKNKYGYESKCKECKKVFRKEYNQRPEVIEKNREYQKKWSREYYDRCPERVQLSQKQWAFKNPDKVQAHLAVNEALRRGELKREPCVECGNEVSQGHHPDYAKALEVIWLCSIHHNQLHSEKSYS